MFNPDASYAVDVLTQEVLGFTATRGARLMSVTVSVPEALATTELAERLRRALARFGLGPRGSAALIARSATFLASEFEICPRDQNNCDRNQHHG